MPEVKDPAIKLFGKTIQLLHLDDVVLGKSNGQQQYRSGHIKENLEKEHATTQTEDTCSDLSTSSGIKDDENSSKSTPEKENPNENSNSEEHPQKPDKILPCPRCNSMNTKFCYYNNYNVNQPRHFCKNCQRYWTAGGSMRNTPVGSGRRKNKRSYSASYYRHLIFSNKSHKSEDDRSANSAEKEGNNEIKDFQGYPLHIPTYLGSPGFPVSFYPTLQYWGCTVQPSPWSMAMPWVATPPSDQFSPISPLGKHSRNGNLLSPSSNTENEELSRNKDSENGILIPKTLRMIDEHGNNLINGGNLCKFFQSKNDEKNEVAATSLANLQANPAALSRSLNFHETS